MKVTIVYESMYGNTHAIADEIAAGFDASVDVEVCVVGEATPAALTSDLLVVGGPTHVHGMSSDRTRDAAVKAAEDAEALHVEEHALDLGLRDWLDALPKDLQGRAAAFDTRADAKPLLTGRASKGIAKRLHHHGLELIDEPESFLVDKHDVLLDGERDRARAWGGQLSELLIAGAVRSDPSR
jgi:hypothetical protein